MARCGSSIERRDVAVRQTAVVLEAEPSVRRGAAIFAGAREGFRSLTVACLFAGGVAWGLGGVAAPVDGAAFLGSVLAVSLAFWALESFDRSRPLVLMAAVAAVGVAVVAAVASPSFSVGLFSFGNGLISRWDTVFDAYVPLFPGQDAGASAPVFFIVAGVVAAAVFLTVAHRRMAVVGALLAFALGGMGLWLGTGAAPLSLASFFAGWIVLCRSAQGDAPALWRTLLAATALVLAATAITAASPVAYHPLRAVDQLRNGIVQGVEDVRFGSDTLPEGDVRASRAMNEGAGERLSVVCEGTASDLLLRGFVGASYEDGTWKALDHTAYEGGWSGMFAWLDESGFRPSTQRSSFDDRYADHEDERIAERAVSVQALGANRKYLYAPSTLRSLDGAGTVAGRDGSLLSNGLFGALSYTMTADDVDAAADAVETPVWLLDDASPEADAYVAAEAVYRSFVEEHYLDVDDADRTLVEGLFYDDATWDESADHSMSAIISRVRIMLETLASYTEHPPAAPSGARFLPWFLSEAHEGNAAYFSTAAVEAFRVQGVPARYAEGYRAEAADVARASAAGDALTLTAADAHAWVEVYVDGVGWSPVEVAPGFYEQRYAVDDVIEVNQSMEGGDAQAPEAGAVGGDAASDEDEPARGVDPLRAMQVAAAVFGAVVALCAAAGIALEAYRVRARARRRARCASDDQAVSVRALYDELVDVVRAGGAPIDPERPFSATAAFATAFPAVASAEYERAVGLVQKSVFGCMQLRAHEMRALRRFNERLKDELEPPKGLKSILKRRYRYVL